LQKRQLENGNKMAKLSVRPCSRQQYAQLPSRNVASLHRDQLAEMPANKCIKTNQTIPIYVKESTRDFFPSDVVHFGVAVEFDATDVAVVVDVEHVDALR